MPVCLHLSCSYLYVCLYCTYVCLCLYCCCCIYFATISGLCRCCLGRCNILMFLMMIWESVLSTFKLYKFLALEHVWCCSRCWHWCCNISMMFWEFIFLIISLLCTCSLLLLYQILELVCMHLYVADAATSYLFWEFSKSQYIFVVHVHCYCFIKRKLEHVFVWPW